VTLARLRAIPQNPVLTRELRVRMRGNRAIWTIAGYLGIIGLVLVIAWSVSVSRMLQDAANSAAPVVTANAGRLLFSTVSVTQAILISLITPGLTSGSIAGERERRTLLMVVTTPLRPHHVVLGKLCAAGAFLALLLITSVPMVSLSFLLGGVSPGEIVTTSISLTICAVLYATIGLYWSAAARTAASATLLAYVSVFILFLGSGVMSVMTMAGAPMGGTAAPLRAMNPIAAVFVGSDPDWLWHLPIPSWLVAGAIYGLVAVVLALEAMAALEHSTVDYSRPVRLSASVAWATFAICIVGTVGARAASGSSLLQPSRALAMAIPWLLPPLLLANAIVSTGELVTRSGREPLRAYLLGALPSRLLRPNLPGALPLLMVWSALPALFGLIGSWIATGHPPSDASRFALAALLIISTTMAYAGVGQLASVIFGARAPALLITALAPVMVFVIQMLGGLAGGSLDNSPPQWATLSPFFAAAALAERSGLPSAIASAWPDRGSLAAATIAAHSIVAALLMATALLVLGARGQSYATAAAARHAREDAAREAFTGA
jgi:ABC-type transport system involved in multi-copper enzyme maturation permease subunit